MADQSIYSTPKSSLVTSELIGVTHRSANCLSSISEKPTLTWVTTCECDVTQLSAWLAGSSTGESLLTAVYCSSGLREGLMKERQRNSNGGQ